MELLPLGALLLDFEETLPLCEPAGEEGLPLTLLFDSVLGVWPSVRPLELADGLEEDGLFPWDADGALELGGLFCEELFEGVVTRETDMRRSEDSKRNGP